MSDSLRLVVLVSGLDICDDDPAELELESFELLEGTKPVAPSGDPTVR